MKRNIRPIPLSPNPEAEALALSLLSGRRRELYLDRLVAPGVMFTKEGIHENRIRELRARRASIMWHAKADDGRPKFSLEQINATRYGA